MNTWQQKEKVRDLRKAGRSYREINKEINVSKSTISRWCADIELTIEQKELLDKKFDKLYRGAQTVKQHRTNEIKKISESAAIEMQNVSEKDLKTIGTMLYWAEGNKTLFPGITNSDQNLIKIMMQWFREVCRVPEQKFKAHLHIHSGQDEQKMKEYWSVITNIPLQQFGKSHVKKEGSGHKKNTLYNGTIKINICDKNLLHRIQGWIKGVCAVLVG